MEKKMNDLLDSVNQIRSEQAFCRDRIMELEREKEMLRQGIRKLKLENTRMKEKMKNLQHAVRGIPGAQTDEVFIYPVGVYLQDDELWNRDFDDLGRNEFILVGGKNDPFSPRYEATIRDDNGIEHRTAERYYWYKMAEHFGDNESAQKILRAETTPVAEEISKQIKNFNETQWRDVKVEIWENAQRYKFEQVREARNLLFATGDEYIAVAEQDKTIGTGWRKNREEANKPIFWDGENAGGRFLMKYRKELQQNHEWDGPHEEEATRQKYNECKKYIWRRIEMNKMQGFQQNVRGGGPVHYRARGYYRGGFTRGGSRGAYRSRGRGSF